MSADWYFEELRRRVRVMPAGVAWALLSHALDEGSITPEQFRSIVDEPRPAAAPLKDE